MAGYKFVIIDIINRGGNSTYDGGLNSRLRDKLLLLVTTSTISFSSLLEERKSI